jgi:formate hydrogenlyase subunit 3/multisubunit Na+/H+ antiporter MnhD subunit
MKFVIYALTGSLAFWQLVELRETNPPAQAVIVCIYALYGFILFIRDYSGRKRS